MSADDVPTYVWIERRLEARKPLPPDASADQRAQYDEWMLVGRAELFVAKIWKGATAVNVEEKKGSRIKIHARLGDNEGVIVEVEALEEDRFEIRDTRPWGLKG